MKKRKTFQSILSFALILVILVQTLVMPSYAQEGATPVLYGDVDSNGAVNDSDVKLLARYLADDMSAEIDLVASDMDRNQTIDLNDLLSLKKLLEGKGHVETRLVTVTFDTNGGDPIEPISLMAGDTTAVPEAQKEHAIFLGWFTEDGEPFHNSDPITEDITVYAKYHEVSGEPEYTPVSLAWAEQNPNFSFKVVRNSGDWEPDEAVILRSADGSIAPLLSFERLGEDKWNVTAEGGYTEGASYTVVLLDGYTFEGKEESIREASFFIPKEQIANLTINEDIIYIQDTAEMTYTFSDGTSCEVLDVNVLYNSEDVVTGSFNYPESSKLAVGDTLCIYVTTIPTQRDYINETYDNDPTAYIIVAGIEGNTISFCGMTMQGTDSDVEKLISLPSTIPFSVLPLPEGDGIIDFDARDRAALIAMYGTNEPSEVKVGDYLAFYEGNFGSLQEGDVVYYKKVIAVNGNIISYVESSQDELVNAINLYLQEDIDSEQLLASIDQDLLEEQLMRRIQETNFVEDAIEYLGNVVACSDEFNQYLVENNITVYDNNGIQLSAEEIKAYGLGSAFILDDNTEPSFNITACDGKNSHFKNGLKIALKLECEGDADSKKLEQIGSLKIGFEAIFTQEIAIDVNINAHADITWGSLLPVINDIIFSSAVDVMSYSGLSLDASFYTQSPDEGFFDKLKAHLGDTLGKDALKKIEQFEDDYEEALGDDGLSEDVDAFYEAQSDLIWELISTGEITKDQAKKCFTTVCENHIVQAFFDEAHLMNDEEYQTGITELTDRYADMLAEEDGDGGWLELCNEKIFEFSVNPWIFQITIEGSLVLRANVNIALHSDLEYETGTRFINWFSIMGNTSGSSKLDLIDSKFAFQFYGMGHIGLRAGIAIEAKVGFICTDLGSVGVSTEMGVFAELYGYFQYQYTKYKPANSQMWQEDDMMMGALYFEYGLYLDINVIADLLNLLEKEWEVYSNKWTLLSAGARENILSFATESVTGEKLVIKDKDNDSTNGIFAEIPDSFRSMNAMDMVTGETDILIQPWVSYLGYNYFPQDGISLTQHYDKTNFAYSLSSSYFSLVPVYDTVGGKRYIVDYEIKVDVPKGVHYITCDLRLVWLPDKLCYSKYDMDLIIPIVWTDLSDRELNEYKTATVKVGNSTDGYRAVWSDRFLSGEIFTLPSTDTILKLAGYTGEDDLRYSGYTGYQKTSFGNTINEDADQSLTFDTIYYFDITPRKYSITVQDVQDSTTNWTFTANYGKSFDFSKLESTGINDDENRKYTAFNGLEVRDHNGAVQFSDPTGVIDDYFATQLLSGEYTYHAKYVNNGATITFKFSDISIPPISQVYRKGSMPPTELYNAHIRSHAENAHAAYITPKLSEVIGDTVYHVSVERTPEPLKQYTITFNSNGGSEVGDIIATERSVIGEPTTPTKKGNRFEYWCYDAALTQEMDWSRPMPSKDFTLHAKWSKKDYTITFDPGLGKTDVPSLPVTYSKPVGPLPTADLANNKLEGWYDAQGKKYAEDTHYEVDDNITLYAHWIPKSTIEVTLKNETVTYTGSAIAPILSISPEGIDASSFTVEFKQQGTSAWITARPVNAGTYDVKIGREEDSEYQKFEQQYTLKVEKRARTISTEGLVAKLNGTTLTVTNVPSYEGGGTPQYAYEKYNGSSWVRSTWQSSGTFKNLSTGKYRVCFYVTEGTNHLKTNEVVLEKEFIVDNFKSVSYKLHTTTSGIAFADTTNPVYANLKYIDGTSGSKVQVSNTRWLGSTGEDTIAGPADPWMIQGIQYTLNGTNAWKCKTTKLVVTTASSSTTFVEKTNSNGLFELENSGSTTIDVSSSFKRKITSVGDFSASKTLTLQGNDGNYVYIYDGTVVDNYAFLTAYGSYNAYNHKNPPTMSITCNSGTSYAKYFKVSGDTITIDRDGLYTAMRNANVSSVSATATLTFDSKSTASGNTWKKSFTVMLDSSPEQEAEPVIDNFKAFSYKLFTTTSDDAYADTTDPVYACLTYSDGASGSKVQVSNTRWLGSTGEDNISNISAPTDPWMIQGIRYTLNGTNAWECETVKLVAHVTANGITNEITCFNSTNSNGLFELKNSSTKTIDVSSYFKRKITSVGDFTDSKILTLRNGDGNYTYTYNGKVVDNYSHWTVYGYYNAYMHSHAPTLSITCNSGTNYAKYFKVNGDTITIDRSGLYTAMYNANVSSVTATATLTFDSKSTSSGNTWTKTFTVKLADDQTQEDEPVIGNSKSISYKLFTTTSRDAFADTTDPVYAYLTYSDGTSGSKVQVSNTRWLGNTGEDAIAAPADPWMIQGIHYALNGTNAWECNAVKLVTYVTANGSSTGTTHVSKFQSDGLFELENYGSTTINVGNAFKRRITNVGDFTDPETLTLLKKNGDYTYTYSGKVVDNYSHWTDYGFYNAYEHTCPPALSITCSAGTNYAQYFKVSADTITIDRSGLYTAMCNAGTPLVTATATLTFDSQSTVSGNVWSKVFKIHCPNASDSSLVPIFPTTPKEDLRCIPGVSQSNVSVQTKENEDYLYVSIRLDRNPGIWGIKNSITFDESKLELLSVKMGELTSMYTAVDTTGNGCYTFLAYCHDPIERYEAGNFVTLAFRKKTTELDPKAALTFSTVQAINDKGQAVDVNDTFNIDAPTSVPPTDENNYNTTPESIVNTLTDAMISRNADTQVFHYRTNTLLTEEDLSAWYENAKAQLESYDQFSIKQYNATASKYTHAGDYYYTLTYQMDFYLTLEQETQLNTKIAEILDSLNVSHKSDLEKIAAVYDYICENVNYNESAENCFTAYGALVDGDAVCQGYSLAMLRMLDELGLNGDVILGTSDDIVNHMWNIVNLDGEYFLLDATWDSHSADPCYAWFLKGSDNFADHLPANAYTVVLSNDDHEKAFELSHTCIDWTYDDMNHWFECTICQAKDLSANHTVVIDEAIAPTCTAEGKTEGSHCSVCNTVIKEQSTISSTGHSYIGSVTTAPTCTTEGIETFTCVDCGDSYGEPLPALGHTEAIDAAVAPTCTNSGMTEGSHCSLCDTVLAAQESVPALGHNYSYTDNLNNTHTVACSRCEYTVAEGHEFTNGMCLCNALENVSPVVDETIRIYHTLNLGCDISVHYVIPVSDLEKYDSFYMECILPVYKGNVQQGTETIKVYPVFMGNYYYFTLTNLSAIRMNDVVRSTLYMTNGNTSYCSLEDKFSIAMYAYQMLNGGTTDKDLIVLCTNLLRYGAEAQIFKGYRTDALADSALPEGSSSSHRNASDWIFSGVDELSNDLENPVVTWVGKTLDLDSKVGIKFVFDASQFNDDISKISMHVSYTDFQGTEKIVILKKPQVYQAAKNYYSFSFYDLLAAELRTAVSVTIYNGATQLSQTLTYSAESYAAKSAGTNLAPLCKALFEYSDSARIYFAK